MSEANCTLERFGLRVVPIDALVTSLAKVRGSRLPRGQHLTPSPIRVLADPEQPDRYEVVDGFKRIAAYRDEGLREVVVIVEPAAEGIPLLQQALVLMLHANALTGSLSAMDEARIVACLVDDHGVTPLRAGRLLGKSKPWVSKRLALARRLAIEAARELDAGRLLLSVAYALCALPRGDQVLLGRQIITLGLPATHALQLIEAYRVADTATERQSLLADPSGVIEQAGGSKGGDVIQLTPTVRERVASYQHLATELRALEQEPPLEGAAPEEARLLRAERQRLEAQISAHASWWQLQATTPSTASSLATRLS